VRRNICKNYDFVNFDGNRTPTAVTPSD